MGGVKTWINRVDETESILALEKNVWTLWGDSHLVLLRIPSSVIAEWPDVDLDGPLF